MKNARTINCTSIAVGDLLHRPIALNVPFYQRDFSWKQDQIDALWEDVVSAMEEGQEEYFIGSIVISLSPDSDKCQIVDGQQRLAIISMIFASISRMWKEKGDDERSFGVAQDYLGTKDRRTKEVIPRISLNEINNTVFQDIIQNEKIYTQTEQKILPHSNKLLIYAYNSVKDKLDKWLKSSRKEEESLIELEEYIAKHLYLITIEVADDSDAFTLFETLNDRGLELAPPDLIKNYLFSLADRNLDNFKRLWSEITLIIGGDKMTQFLRYFWASEYGFVREKELYKTLKESIKSSTRARQLVERLRMSSDLYSALLNTEHSFWADYQPEVKKYLDTLLTFNVTQYRPIAMAAMEKMDQDRVIKLLKLLMIISFRYSIISSLSTNELEKQYSRLAIAIRSEEQRSINDLYQKHLKPLYINDDKFESDFVNKIFDKAKIARYVLGEINDFQESTRERKVAERSGIITLEHILPENPNDDWKDSLPESEDKEQYIYMIGNLTLLERMKNINISNMKFIEKRDNAYRQSNLIINASLKEKESWKHTDIIKRTKELVSIAKSVWKIDL